MKNNKYLDAKYKKINQLISIKQYAEARSVAEEALKEVPNDLQLNNILCSILILFKDNEKAISLAMNCIENIKEDSITFFYLSQAKWNTGKKEEAIENTFNSLRLNKQFKEGYSLLIRYLSNMSTLDFLDKKETEDILLNGIDNGFLKINDLEILILKFYINHFNSSSSVRLEEINPKEKINDDVLTSFKKEIFEKDLFLKLLDSMPMRVDLFENFLTTIRKEFLMDISNETKKSINIKGLVSLAEQSFRNGYSWFVANDEEKLIEKIILKLKKDAKENNNLDENKIALLGSYKYLCGYPEIEKYLTKKNVINLEIHKLINSHIIDIVEERNILDKVKELNIKSEETPQTSFKDITRPVAYNQLKDLSLINFIKKDISPAQILEKEKEKEKPKILILGSSSVEKSFFYRGIDGIKIDVIDENKARLAHGIRITKKNKIKNINFFRGNIDDLESLNTKYDLIDTFRNINFDYNGNELFEKLCTYLEPGGFIRLELISKKEFSLLKAAQKHIKKGENIRSVRRLLREIEDDEIKLFIQKKYFYNGSLLKEYLNKEIVNFVSLKECKNLMEKQKLKFLGWSHIVDVNLRNLFFTNYNKVYKDDIIYNKIQNWINFEEKYPFSNSENYSFWLKKES